MADISFRSSFAPSVFPFASLALHALSYIGFACLFDAFGCFWGSNLAIMVTPLEMLCSVN